LFTAEFFIHCVFVTFQMNKNNYFILTGAMGAGKTTVINKIREQGYFCIDEPARIILKEQRITGGVGVPEKNPELFNELMLAKMISEYKNNLERNEVVVFDRGIPDIIAYADLLQTQKEMSEIAAAEFRYNKHVFMFNGCEDIYKNDDERKVDFQTANNFGMELRKKYKGLDYTIIDVPLLPIDERAGFIIAAINSFKD
jgi:predicted ATPase